MDDRRIKLEAYGCGRDFRLTLKRNCSISPRALMGVLGVTMLFSSGIALGFAWFGAWMVLPFAGLEMLALALACYVNGRHAADFERIERSDNRLDVETHEAQRVRKRSFEASRARVLMREEGPQGLRVVIAQGRDELEIGRHLDAAARRLVADMLRERLRHSFRTIGTTGTT